VQSGSTNEEVAEREGLSSLGSLFVEPLWLFLREEKGKPPITKLTQLRGKKINFGAKGAGSPRLFRQVLELNGWRRTKSSAIRWPTRRPRWNCWKAASTAWCSLPRRKRR
jgi:TRAP-type uncharacterized transport system substrate-binding protein